MLNKTKCHGLNQKPRGKAVIIAPSRVLERSWRALPVISWLPCCVVGSETARGWLMPTGAGSLVAQPERRGVRRDWERGRVLYDPASAAELAWKVPGCVVAAQRER